VDIEPWTYLRELLLRLHDDNPRLDEMLPDQWAIQHPEAVLNYRLKNLVAKRRLEVVAAVTREQAIGPADRQTHTMPRPDAYAFDELTEL